MSEQQTPGRVTPISRRGWIDVVVVTALGAIGVVGFAPTFGGAAFLLAGFGGLLVGTGSAIAGHLLRLGPLTTALAAVVAYFALGSAFAMPGQALFLVVPSFDSLAGLALGAVYGWADILTLTTPVAAPDYVAVVPYVAAWLTGLVATTLALRFRPDARRTTGVRAVVLIAPLALYVAGILLGTEEPYLAVVRGVAFAIVGLSWMLWRTSTNSALTDATRAAIVRRRAVGFVAVLGTAAVVGSLLGVAAAPPEDQRFVLREQVEPPLEQYLFSSPLAGFRRYHQEAPAGDAETTLFRVTGLSEGQRIRLATMDYYDGTLWRVTSPTLFAEASGGFDLVGRQLPAPEYADVEGDVEVAIEVVGYDDIWLPTVGYPRLLDFSAGAPRSTALRYNPMTGISLVTSGVREGMAYTLQGDVQRPISVNDVSSYSPARDIPVAVVEAASVSVSARGQELSASVDAPFEKIRAIEEALVATGSLSHGESAGGQSSVAGHNLYRLDQLMVQLIGDHEQYAAATALMAHELGFPVRVVMGFAPERAGAPGAVEVVGADAVAWVEVAVEGLGWVPLEPTPDQEVPPPPVPQPRTEPQPLVRQPPPIPNTQDDQVTPTAIVESDADDDDDEDEDEGFAIPGWVWAVIAWTLIPLAILLVPMMIIAAVKATRRRRRRARGPADRRAAGAWEELVDRYGELGYATSRRSTRVGLALDFERQFRDELAARQRERRTAEAKTARSNRPQELTDTEATVVRSAGPEEVWRPGVEQKRAPLPAIPGLREFAVHIDRAVFAAESVEPAELDRLWSELDDAARAARASVTPMRRLLSRYRVRSRNDLVAGLSDRLTDAAARRRPRGVPAT